jgi:hypothetical protein
MTPQITAALQAIQPLRLKYAVFSDKNPIVHALSPLAEKARTDRKPAADNNPYLTMQQQVSDAVTGGFKAIGNLRDKLAEAIFHAIYGSHWVQGFLGVTDNGRPRPKPGTSPDHEAELAAQAKELLSTMAVGGPLEAMVRAGLYIVAKQHAIDARTFEFLRRTVKAHPEITLAYFKEVVREQWARLVVDEKAALRALPQLLPADAATRRELFEHIRMICTVTGELEGEAKRRLEEINGLFEAGPSAASTKPAYAMSS